MSHTFAGSLPVELTLVSETGRTQAGILSRDQNLPPAESWNMPVAWRKTLFPLGLSMSQSSRQEGDAAFPWAFVHLHQKYFMMHLPQWGSPSAEGEIPEDGGEC